MHWGLAFRTLTPPRVVWEGDTEDTRSRSLWQQQPNSSQHAALCTPKVCTPLPASLPAPGPVSASHLGFSFVPLFPSVTFAFIPPVNLSRAPESAASVCSAVGLTGLHNILSSSPAAPLRTSLFLHREPSNNCVSKMKRQPCF